METQTKANVFFNRPAMWVPIVKRGHSFLSSFSFHTITSQIKTLYEQEISERPEENAGIKGPSTHQLQKELAVVNPLLAYHFIFYRNPQKCFGKEQRAVLKNKCKTPTLKQRVKAFFKENGLKQKQNILKAEELWNRLYKCFLAIFLVLIRPTQDLQAFR